jgi:integrase/recombinase XerD
MKKIFLQANDDVTFEEAVDSYIRKCKIRNRADKTILLYKEDIADFLKHCGETIEYINDVIPTVVENYTLNRKTDTCSQISVNSHLRSIRDFLYWCMEEK